MMEEYGGSIARYSEYVGINMILGPVLDLADYIAPLGKPAEKASSPRVAPRRE